MKTITFQTITVKTITFQTITVKPIIVPTITLYIIEFKTNHLQNNHSSDNHSSNNQCRQSLSRQSQWRQSQSQRCSYLRPASVSKDFASVKVLCVTGERPTKTYIQEIRYTQKCIREKMAQKLLISNVHMKMQLWKMPIEDITTFNKDKKH